MLGRQQMENKTNNDPRFVMRGFDFGSYERERAAEQAKAAERLQQIAANMVANAIDFEHSSTQSNRHIDAMAPVDAVIDHMGTE